jgi:threonylcarbamoyladenosine tRNA methylthiotransferase MtaB
MIFGFCTLGCKVNQYETQAMEQLLISEGHTVAPFSDKCDVYIINTCSVTAVADKKNRAIIRRCRKANPDAIIAVCGCYPQHNSDAVAALGVDVIGGSNGRIQFLQNIMAFYQEKKAVFQVDNALLRRDFEILPPGGLTGRTRAMLKVQDGCQNFCTYCIIPYTRGPIRSATVELAVAQAKALQEKGYQELVITGIEIASWGRDLPGRPGLSLLLEALSEAVPGVRLRLGSLEPRIITEEFCQQIKKLPGLCPHFHLSMQSGCDSVLSRMKRKYDTARYLESVQLLNKYFPGCAITTDMIVAFPGETEEEFTQSLRFIERCGFADMHIFPYSRRPGTPADKMPGQLGNETKESRSRAAIAVAEKMAKAYRENMVGKWYDVLFEESEDGYFVGHTPNYVKVYVETSETLHNTLRTVRVTEAFRDGVLAVLEDIPE